MLTPPHHTRAVVLQRRPQGSPRPDDFALVQQPLPRPHRGAVVVGVADLSLDPYLRSVLGGGHLAQAALALDSAVVPGTAVAVVLESEHPSFTPGDWVVGDIGWREHGVVAGDALRPVPVIDGLPRSAVLGAAGMPGLTAYAALERHLRPQPGETVAISSATGGVGATAGQLARARGARTVAIVGSAEKAADALGLGYEAAVVRTAPDWATDLARACPDGIDGYLHMGDQQTLDCVLDRLSVGARISLCGLMDQYNDGPRTVLDAGRVMSARASVHGMVVYDHQDLAAVHRQVVAGLVATNRLRLHEHRTIGLASAPAAFCELMSGANRGKAVVEVARFS